MTINDVIGISVKKGFVVLEVLGKDGLDGIKEARYNLWLSNDCDITVLNAETVEIDSN